MEKRRESRKEGEGEVKSEEGKTKERQGEKEKRTW